MEKRTTAIQSIFKCLASKLPEISAVLEEVLSFVFPDLDLPPIFFILQVAELIQKLEKQFCKLKTKKILDKANLHNHLRFKAKQYFYDQYIALDIPKTIYLANNNNLINKETQYTRVKKQKTNDQVMSIPSAIQ